MAKNHLSSSLLSFLTIKICEEFQPSMKSLPWKCRGPHWSTAAGQEGSLWPNLSPWNPSLPEAQSTGEKWAQLPCHTIAGLNTDENLYFTDVIIANQQIILALMWQSLVLSVIHVHCLYPLQFRKLRAVATPGTLWQHLLPGITATVTSIAQWPPQPSGQHSPVLWMDYSEVQETEPANLLTGANSTASFPLLWELTAPLSHFWLCCIYIFCRSQCKVTILCISFLPALKAH